MIAILDEVLVLTSNISGMIWWPLVIFLLFFTGIYLTIKTRFIQIRKLAEGVRMVFDKDSQEGEGAISPFQALMTSLAATVGNGNIAGVSTAIVAGGPGAIFWMWLSAFFGMSTKYAEGLLGRKYRVQDKDGKFSGGPMYYLEKMGSPKLGKFLAVWFALALVLVGLIGSGNMAQSNSIALAMNAEFGVPYYMTAIVLGILVLSILYGGLKRIADFSEKMVPLMIGLYIISGLIIIVMNYEAIPKVFNLIISSAFDFQSAAGGVAGHTVKEALRFGVSRGVLSNESGTGSCAIPAAVAKSKDNASQGIVAMMGTFIDTIIVCSMTAFIILATRDQLGADLNSVALTKAAFTYGLGGSIGGLAISFSSIVFGFSTLIAYAYFAEQGIHYLFPNLSVKKFRVVYAVFSVLGAVLQGKYLGIVWNLSDIANALMVFPNLIGLLALTKVIVKETK